MRKRLMQAKCGLVPYYTANGSKVSARIPDSWSTSRYLGAILESWASFDCPGPTSVAFSLNSLPANRAESRKMIEHRTAGVERTQLMT
ncbi:hypothetical protein LTR28_002020 [Elasticomyces elasticus]|nr:hypothetical protein LTR28_002020 [Elasticomyces elasticus]